MADKNTDITRKSFICVKCEDDTENSEFCDRCEELIKVHGEEAVDAYIEVIGSSYLDNFEEAYSGKYDSNGEFVKELLKDTEPALQDFPVYIHIDWERTARDIMMDYAEQDGYYFRN